MKRFLKFLLPIVLVVSACTGKEGPPGMDGRDGMVNKVIRDFEILEEDWVAVFDPLSPVVDPDEPNIFQYLFSFPHLTRNVYDNGLVAVYLEQFIDDIVFQTPLPYTYYGEDFSENYTFEFGPGYINFIVKISDFDTQAQQPLSCLFRVVLMW